MIQEGDLVTRRGSSITGRVLWTRTDRRDGNTLARVLWSSTMTGGKRRGMAPLINVARLQKVKEG